MLWKGSGGSTKRGPSTSWTWPCPSRMVGCRSPSATTPLTFVFEFFRGALWIALAAPVIRTTRGKVWEAGLIIVLLFALVQNDVHLVPNPLMPYSVALSHFIETASSNLIFAVILTWLMARKAKLPQTRFGDCYDPGHVESISRLTRRV